MIALAPSLLTFAQTLGRRLKGGKQ